MSKVASIQMASGPNVQANLDGAAKLIEEAVSKSAELVVLPENFALMPMTELERVGYAEKPGVGIMQDFLRNQSKKHGIWLVGGTIPMQCDVKGKAYSASLLFNDKGEQVARYNKIHMFDVWLEDNNESYNESQTTLAGEDIVVVDTPFGRLGMSICYDLRFPEMFRTMVDHGMEICVIPSSFTAFTGKAHWEPLLRARAIENLCFIVAAGQGGFHINNRKTYGHSMIIDPWGKILGVRETGPGVVVAELDRDYLISTRKNFQVLKHRRLNCNIS